MTVQMYRKDLYDAKGLKPAETLDQIVTNAKALHDPGNRPVGWRCAACRRRPEHVHLPVDLPRLRRQVVPRRQDRGQHARGGDGARVVREALTNYAPPAVRNWNWPDIADAFSQGTIGHLPRRALLRRGDHQPRARKVVGKIAYARWPKGPSGRRVTSIWNWGFPINAALSDKAKRATWLFIEWAASAETQARTSYLWTGPGKRYGVNRMSIWRSTEFAAAMKNAGDNFLQASLESLEQDTDVDWRPRVPQWPAIGETMATAIQAALVGQKKPKEALDDAQTRIEQILRG